MVCRRSLLHGWQSALIMSFNEIIPPTASWPIYLPNRKIPLTTSTFSSSTRWSKFGCFFFGTKTGSSSNSSCKDTRWSYLVAALQNMVGSRCVRNLKKTLGWNRDHFSVWRIFFQMGWKHYSDGLEVRMTARAPWWKKQSFARTLRQRRTIVHVTRRNVPGGFWGDDGTIVIICREGASFSCDVVFTEECVLRLVATDDTIEAGVY